MIAWARAAPFGPTSCAAVTASDLIRMVLYVYKVLPLCDVCPLIGDGVWECP